MKDKILKRGLLGFPMGISIGFIITIIISMCVDDGNYYPVTPSLLEVTKSEISAVIYQTVLCGIMGAGFSMASVIWEIDSWSIAKQTGIYFGISCVLMFPISYALHWMSRTVFGIISYIGIFILIFLIIWFIQYFLWKSGIKKLNDRISTVEKNE